MSVLHDCEHLSPECHGSRKPQDLDRRIEPIPISTLVVPCVAPKYPRSHHAEGFLGRNQR